MPLPAMDELLASFETMTQRFSTPLCKKEKYLLECFLSKKIHLIECLKDLGRQVIMCGDGCNDCGALKSAHAGISLSMAEASVAAPFTSRNVHIGCVPDVIREGRATMVSAFATFKFGVAFCFTQLIAVLMVFYIGTEPSDNQYLVVDIGLAAVPIIMIGNNGPHDSLVKQKPTRHLLSFLPLFSIVTFLLFQTLGYIGVWFFVRSQDWFESYVFEEGLWPPNPSFEQTNIFLMSCAAATIGAIVFSKGAPYRKPLYTNGIMMGWTIAAVTTTVFMSLYDSEDFRTRLNMKIGSMDFRIKLVAIMFIDFAFCYVWEVYFLDGILFFKVLPFYKEKFRGPHLPFEHLEEELKTKHNWPPVTGSKNNETKIAMPRGYGMAPQKTLIDQQTQTPGDGVTVALRAQLKNATRNIKNRWSSSGISADGREVGVAVGNMESEEAQQLLSKGGGDTPPNETPTHQPSRLQNIHRYPSVDPPPYNPPTLPVAAIPPTSQLQRVINNTLQRSSESRMLSETIC